MISPVCQNKECLKDLPMQKLKKTTVEYGDMRHTILDRNGLVRVSWYRCPRCSSFVLLPK